MKKILLIVTAVMVLVSHGVYAYHGNHTAIAATQADTMTDLAFAQIVKAQDMKSISLTFASADVYTENCRVTVIGDSEYQNTSGQIYQAADEESCKARLDIQIPAGSIIRRVELFNSVGGYYKDNSDYGHFKIQIDNLRDFYSGHDVSPDSYGYNAETGVYSQNVNRKLLTNEVLSLYIYDEFYYDDDYEMYGVTVYYE